VKINNVASAVAVYLLDLWEYILGRFSGPICPLNGGDVLIRMHSLKKAFKGNGRGDLSSPA